MGGVTGNVRDLLLRRSFICFQMHTIIISNSLNENKNKEADLTILLNSIFFKFSTSFIDM